jgi:hypothetical protein
MAMILRGALKVSVSHFAQRTKGPFQQSQPFAAHLGCDHARFIALVVEVTLAALAHRVALPGDPVEFAVEILARQSERLDHNHRQRRAAERLEEFCAAPFSEAKDVHEAAFRQVNPEGFIPIDQLRLKSIDLKKALLAIIDTITFEAG